MISTCRKRMLSSRSWACLMKSSISRSSMKRWVPSMNKGKEEWWMLLLQVQEESGEREHVVCSSFPAPPRREEQQCKQIGIKPQTVYFCDQISYRKQVSIPALPAILFSSPIQEIRELQSQIQNTMVTVEMDNNRELEMKHIIDEVKAQYQTMAAKSREEAEQWYKNKVSAIVI